jgi:predicted nucleic acid-binding protein
MRFVIDASSVGNIILPDEQGPVSAAFEDFMLDAVLVQPAHWPIEIAGLVLKASRRERLPVSARTLAREAIKLLVDAAEIEPQSAAIAAFDLAIKYHISVYDAAYLELALRQGLPLMTGDAALGEALSKAGGIAVS